VNNNLRPGQSIGNRNPNQVIRSAPDTGTGYRVPGTRYSPGLVIPTIVRSTSRDGADWRITTDGSGPFVRNMSVPSDHGTYREYLDEEVGPHVRGVGIGSASYGRPRSGRPSKVRK